MSLSDDVCAAASFTCNIARRHRDFDARNRDAAMTSAALGAFRALLLSRTPCLAVVPAKAGTHTPFSLNEARQSQTYNSGGYGSPLSRGRQIISQRIRRTRSGMAYSAADAA